MQNQVLPCFLSIQIFADFRLTTPDNHHQTKLDGHQIIERHVTDDATFISSNHSYIIELGIIFIPPLPIMDWRILNLLGLLHLFLSFVNREWIPSACLLARTGHG
jgi:hypothetical protein